VTPADPPLRDCSPCSHAHARRESLGFVPRVHARQTRNVAIRNFCISLYGEGSRLSLCMERARTPSPSPRPTTAATRGRRPARWKGATAPALVCRGCTRGPAARKQPCAPRPARRCCWAGSCGARGSTCARRPATRLQTTPRAIIPRVRRCRSSEADALAVERSLSLSLSLSLFLSTTRRSSSSRTQTLRAEGGAVSQFRCWRRRAAGLEPGGQVGLH
jgi:hypothetical protein